MSQNVTMIDRLLANIRKEREANRKAFKKDIQTLVNEEKIDYAEALGAMQESRLFEISPYILEHTGEDEACEIFEMYDENNEYKYETIYFTDITDWIEWSEGEVQEALDAAGISNPYKALYDYAMKTNYIGNIFDW
jgi:hypothetical protein